MQDSMALQTQYTAEQGKITNSSLDRIEQKLDAEIAAKQKTIELQEDEVLRLHKLIEQKNGFLMQLNEKLLLLEKANEGNKQLINKLLNDIERLNQDVEWYKKTYEARSLPGVILDKLKHFFRSKK